MNPLTALKRSPLGLDLYLWRVYRTFALRASAAAHLAAPVQPVRSAPDNAHDKNIVNAFLRKVLRELKKIKMAWPDLSYSTAKGVLVLLPSTPGHRAAQSRPANKLGSPFPASQRPRRAGSDLLGSPKSQSSLSA